MWGTEEHMEVTGLVVGWRGLSLAVGALLGRPVGIGVVRWGVERSGLPVGKKVGGTMLFEQADVELAARLVDRQRA
jgi:hypothetical protein